MKFSGSLADGQSVALRRSKNSYPDYFDDLFADVNDVIALKTFRTMQEQDAWIAEQVRKNLDDNEIDHDDILIIIPDAYTARQDPGRSWMH